ncbi:hypothetical protein C8Q77DRAFT_1144104 [Trametes polyzona]|nr:hypothetical protein C8Q77DRAFT_1144104 [Trametes polyzona]
MDSAVTAASTWARDPCRASAFSGAAPTGPSVANGEWPVAYRLHASGRKPGGRLWYCGSDRRF